MLTTAESFYLMHHIQQEGIGLKKPIIQWQRGVREVQRSF